MNFNGVTAQLIAAGLPVDPNNPTVAMVQATDPKPTQTWHHHPSGPFLRLDWTVAPTLPQTIQAENIVQAFVPPTPAEEVRSGAKGLLAASLAHGALFRAVAGLLVDELNILRALHGLAPRTLAQAKAAIVAKLDSGSAD